MITEEEIKNLKRGDKLVIEGTFDRTYEDGDISVQVNVTKFGGDGVVKDTIYCHPSCVSPINPYEPLRLDSINRIPETAPKYDPCRLFKKGDKVKLVEWNGRKLWEDIPHLHRIYDENGTFTVRIDELSGAKVAIIPDAYTENVYLACPVCLKLVTPVEDLEPYFIEEISNGYKLMKRNGKQLANYWEDHPHAKEAAEAERDRLNAEYRKEQK